MVTVQDKADVEDERRENERKEQEGEPGEGAGTDSSTCFSEQSDDDSDVETWSEYEARQQRSQPQPPSAESEKSSFDAAYAAKESDDDTKEVNCEEECADTEEDLERATSPPHSPSTNSEKSSSVSDTEHTARGSDFDQQDDDDTEEVNCDEECPNMGEELYSERSPPHPPSAETENSSAVSDTEYAAKEGAFDPPDDDDPEIVNWDEAMEFLQQALNREEIKSNSLNAKLLQTTHRLQQLEEEKLQVDQECSRLREERREATNMKELAEQELARAAAEMEKALQINAAAERLMEDVGSDRLQVTEKQKELQVLRSRLELELVEKTNEAEREKRKYLDLIQAKLAEQSEAQQDSENSMNAASPSAMDCDTEMSTTDTTNIPTPDEPPNPRKRKVATAPPKRNRKQKKADPPKHKHLPCTECGKHYISPSSETINNKLKQKYEMQLILCLVFS
jgi:hypothetical protein